MAAEAVCNPDGACDLIEAFTGLLEKSLLRREGEDDPRFLMLEIIREYGLERLQASGEEAEIRRRHAMYYLTLAEAAEPMLREAEQEDWQNLLDWETDNLRLALAWAQETGEIELGVRIAGALQRFWHVQGRLSEGRRWLESLLAPDTGAPGGQLGARRPFAPLVP
jgi:predicted ATPase